MKRYDRVTPEGTRDLLFEECSLRRSAENTLRELYQSRGFSEVMTPGIEFYDVFNSGVGRLSQNEMYTLTDNSGRLLVLRPDSTKPIARLYASRLKGTPLPIRLFYNQSVYKRNIDYYRKSDECMQVGVELIGAEGFKADSEMIYLCAESLKLLFGENFIIEIGHTGFFNALVRCLNLNESDEAELRRTIATKNYPALNSLADRVGGSAASVRKLPELFGKRDVLKKARELYSSAEVQPSLEYLAKILDLLDSMGLGENVMLDLSVVNDYEYYTGVVFKGFVGGFGQEIISGGRYDTLYSDFGLNLPAIGFAVNADAVLKVCQQKKMRTEAIERAEIVDCLEEDLERAFEYMRRRSAEGVRCELSLFKDPQESAAYAREKGCRLIHVSRKGACEVKI